jgi:hypothetical protein
MALRYALATPNPHRARSEIVQRRRNSKMVHDPEPSITSPNSSHALPFQRFNCICRIGW